MHRVPPSAAAALRWAGRALMAAAALVLLWDIARLVMFFLREETFVQDADLYLAVGRGMLNGLQPYRDLFEIKPPGVFLLSAASLALLGTPWLGNLAGAATLLAVPAATVAFAARETRNAPPATRATLLGFAFLASGFWTLFMAEKGQAWQTEVFGSLPALLYVATLFLGRPRSRLRLACAALGLLGAVGMKEPFVLSCFAAAALAVATPRELLPRFFWPLVAAVAAGMTAAALLGVLVPYVSLYLPTLAYRGYAFAPLWVRGLFLWKTIVNLAHLSPLAPLAAGMLLASCAVLGARGNGRSAVVWNVCRPLVALYAALLAVGSAGDFQAHHFVFLTPLFLALVWHAVRAALAAWSSPHVARGAAVVTAVWALVILTARQPATAMLVPSAEIAEARAAAAGIDTVLDRCGIDRYLLILKDALHPWAYTRHSPLNHALFHQIDNGVQYGQRFLDISIERLSAARVIVFPLETYVANNPVGNAMGPYIQRTFSETPPPCAAPLPDVPGYGLLFRISDEPFPQKFTFDVPPKGG